MTASLRSFEPAFMSAVYCFQSLSLAPGFFGALFLVLLRIAIGWVLTSTHFGQIISGSLETSDRSISNDAQTRVSAVYEWTPIQFVQLRGGTRIQDGIPQINSQHTRLYFVELHGFF